MFKLSSKILLLGIMLCPSYVFAMDNAVYIALSKKTALSRHMQIIANNVANVNTVGFKGDRVIYNEHRMMGGSKRNKLSYANDIATVRSTELGNTKITNRQLDLAINGSGYFIIDAPFGVAYTRTGNFIININGFLSTSQGYPVLAPNLQPIFFLPEDSSITVRSNGLLSVGTEDRGQIAIVQFENEQLLKKVGDSLYRTEQAYFPATNFEIVQGGLELSNVNAVKQMTTMMEINRATASTSNLINTMNELQLNAIRTLARKSN